MTREEARQLLEQLRQLPDDVPEIDQAEVAEWIVALTDPDDRIIERSASPAWSTATPYGSRG